MTFQMNMNTWMLIKYENNISYNWSACLRKTYVICGQSVKGQSYTINICDNKWKC